jgi:hypothetical protein
VKTPSASILAILAGLIAAPAALAQTAAGAGQAASAATSQSSGEASSSPDLEARLRAAQRRLESAQRRLEAAAQEVAELSAERGQAVIRRYSVFVDGPGRAIIGVQLDNASGGAGARVLDVSPGGPAAEAGIRAGDVITAVNGTEVKGDDAARQVVRIVRDLKPESTVRIEVSRNGKTQPFTLTTRRGPAFALFGPGPGPEGPAMPALPAPPAPPAGSFGPGSMPFLLGEGPLADMELATLTPRLGSYFGTDKGVLVVRAPAGGALKLEDGDVILSIDGRMPSSGPHATRILASYQPGEKVDLAIMRERKRLNIETTMPQGARGGDQFYFRSGGFTAPRGPGRVVIMRGGEST